MASGLGGFGIEIGGIVPFLVEGVRRPGLHPVADLSLAGVGDFF